ncbi:ran-specific GTPase-activating protein-like isoform X2 [Mya arenaria]|uniref:ran-specific GTPase-activating protein-like isoform X2 n=1 Tax=Mya arenaria TaxID=6604 RepID=UPI0022E52CCE|nr:ran-specific GTPase-activating protein-like isoform X2 [Mya arenaria]
MYTSMEEVDSPDVHFEPIIKLDPVDVVTLEEEEDELVQMRAKLFRFDNASEPPEWKERGTGTVKLLRHKSSNLVRVLMRRDKTHKLCANHYVQPEMTLKPNCGSEKAWVWTTNSDFSDGEPRPELLAIRFANAEIAQKWKAKFEEAQEIMKEAIPKHNETIGEDPTSNGKARTEDETEKETQKAGGDTKSDTQNTEADKVADQLETLTVKEDKSGSESSEKTQTNKTDDEKVDNKEENA